MSTDEKDRKVRDAFGADRIANLYDVPREMVCPEGCKHPAHQDCVSPEPGRHPLYTTQSDHDELAEHLADLLDSAMHLEACWISEDETRCVCIIGALRAVLPRCGHVEQVGTKGLTRQCLSTVHPSKAYKHVFGTV